MFNVLQRFSSTNREISADKQGTSLRQIRKVVTTDREAIRGSGRQIGRIGATNGEQKRLYLIKSLRI